MILNRKQFSSVLGFVFEFGDIAKAKAALEAFEQFQNQMKVEGLDYNDAFDLLPDAEDAELNKPENGQDIQHGG